MNYAEFTNRLIDRALKRDRIEMPVALAAFRFSDIGPLPTEGDINGSLLEIAQALSSIRDPFEFSRVTLYAGYLIERGGSGKLIGTVAAQQMGRVLALAVTALGMSDGDDLQQCGKSLIAIDPMGASAIFGIEPLVAALVGIWSVDRQGLRVARDSAGLRGYLEKIAKITPLANFLMLLLDGSDHESILFVDPIRRNGLKVIADNVRNGFQLFTLFEAVLLNPGSPFEYQTLVVPEIDIAIAKGEKEPEGDHTMKAHFDYFNWSAWGKTELLVDAPTRWIWGELPLPCIPQVKDCIVVLFEAPKYIRTWDARIVTRVHPAARSSVQLNSVLTDSDVDSLLDMIADAPVSIRDRMKYAGVQF